MVRAGATPLQAVQSATKNAAELLKIDDMVGSIEENKLADFIVIEENPLEDITTLQKKKYIKRKININKSIGHLSRCFIINIQQVLE